MAPMAYNLHVDHPCFPLLNKFELHVNCDYAGESVEMGWEGNDFQGGVTVMSLAPLFKSNSKITGNRAFGCGSPRPHSRWSRNGERISILTVSSWPTTTIPTWLHYASGSFSVNRNISNCQRCALFFRGCHLSL